MNDNAGLTISGVALGTPGYMVPEQAAGRSDKLGPQTDIYALGAILYKMLTGRPPFHADTTAATIRQVLTEEPAPPSRLNSRTLREPGNDLLEMSEQRAAPAVLIRRRAGGRLAAV